MPRLLSKKVIIRCEHEVSYRIVSRAEVRIEVELFGPNSICRAYAHMVYGSKHQHFTLHSITLFVLNISATRPYVANAT